VPSGRSGGGSWRRRRVIPVAIRGGTTPAHAIRAALQTFPRCDGRHPRANGWAAAQPSRNVERQHLRSRCMRGSRQGLGPLGVGAMGLRLGWFRSGAAERWCASPQAASAPCSTRGIRQAQGRHSVNLVSHGLPHRNRLFQASNCKNLLRDGRSDFLGRLSRRWGWGDQ